jgi:hypothetical protein
MTAETPPSGRDVQEFVGPVRIGMRAQHPNDHKLRLKEFLAEHRHEGNTATFAHISAGAPDVASAARTRDCSLPEWISPCNPSAGRPIYGQSPRSQP